ncbi:type III-B CRISPR module RAMP protein Cmr6 [Halonatronum saccharophilum]|uniref:type III-B CRISPR module RAMP protein Cmr6 n=1 Tax=Halonatronum saccharophilum TaxID=150060 RepID=UPI0004B01295|nr:type III-B CRISPR module RAMP protein Cmr6 [Halonatronum saccharophilum]
MTRENSNFQGDLGWLFYKGYYSFFGQDEHKKVLKEFWDAKDSSDKKRIKDAEDRLKELKEFMGKQYGKKNNLLKSYRFEVATDDKKRELNNKQRLKFKTTYPGLLIGSGYSHETKTDGEFKLGFEFDYTTGLPIIPGSSVKGLLRSAFPVEGERYDEEKEEYIKEILESIFDRSENKVKSDAKEVDTYILRDEIFEGVDENRECLSIYDRDIFYDAKIVESRYRGGGKEDKGRIVGEDYITPHGDNPLKDPTPLKFLKVLPNVIFEFEFDLKGSIVSDIKITAKEKRELFRTIVLDLGIGAKTNVGYGYLEDVD